MSGVSVGTGASAGDDAIYTVATLPTASTATKARSAFVSDALTPTVLSAVTGGGAVFVRVFCNGTTWIVG